MIYSPGKTAIYYAPSSLSGTYIMPETVTLVGPKAFSFCKALKTVISSPVLETIGEYAFYNSGLTSIYLPPTLKSIEWRAFEYCDLKKIVLPKSAKKEAYATYLIAYPNNNVVYENGFVYSSDRTILYCVPPTVSGNFTIPSTVTTIGDYAFADCAALTSVTLTSPIKKVGKNVWKGCDALTSIRVEAAAIEGTSGKLFPESVVSAATLYVPESLIPAVTGKNPWKQFSRVEPLK